MGRKLEIDPAKLRDMVERARRLAGEGCDDLTRNRLERAAEEYDQRAREIEMEGTTGQ